MVALDEGVVKLELEASCEQHTAVLPFAVCNAGHDRATGGEDSLEVGSPQVASCNEFIETDSAYASRAIDVVMVGERRL